MDAREQIRQFIVKNALLGASDQKLDDGDSFLEKGIIDSTGILEIVSFVEDEFEIEVADEELIPENFDSVDRLVEYVERKSTG